MRHNMYRYEWHVNTYRIEQPFMCRAMEMHDRLKLARERANFDTAADAARRFGWTASTYRAAENGQRNITRDKAIEYARAFRVAPEWLLYGRGEAATKLVPLVGHVGAGAEIFPIDDGGALDEIDPPPGCGPQAVAVKVKGDSMYPRYMEGDVLIYDEHKPLEYANGHECVVALPDGRRYVKIVRRQPDGMVTLESWNAPPMHDLTADWFAPIQWVKRL